MRRLIAGVCGVGVVAASTAFQLQPQSAGGRLADARSPVLALSGSFSRVKEERLERIVAGERWHEVWDEHVGEQGEKDALGWPVRPEIDFERFMVVAIFGGERVNHSGWEVQSWSERDDHVLVRYDARTFQTAAPIGEEDHGRATTTYGFFVLPRSTKELRLEENVQGLIAGPPRWKQTHRFARLAE